MNSVYTLYLEDLRPRDARQICGARVLGCEIVQRVSSIGPSLRERYRDVLFR